LRIPIISSLIEKRAVKTSGLARPESWLVDALGGRPVASGIKVTEETALRSTAVYGSVRIISETIASLPLLVYERLEKGKQTAVNHPLYTVLHDQANSEMTSFTFREVLQGHLLLWGNAYAEIEKNNAGQIIGLWPLRPDRTWPERDSKTGEIVYKTILSDGTGVILPKDRVLHIPGFGFDGLIGYSPIHIAREAVGLALATEEFGAKFFGQGTRLSGVLEHPGKLTKEALERLKESWVQAYSGLSNSHRIAILEEGMKWQQIGVPPEDAQFLETRKFQVTEIARIFRVPPHMLADLDRATFSNIEHQSIEFVVHTIRPWLVRWEQAILWKLFTPAERKRYFAEFKVDGLLRGDIKSRYEAYAIGRQNGWLSANDIRELENMNPIPDGDIYLVNGNMIPVTTATNTQEELTPTRSEKRNMPKYEIRAEAIRRGVANSYKKVIAETVRRIIRREEADIMRQAQKYFGKRNIDPSVFLAWLYDFYREHEEYIETQMMPVFMALAEAVNAAAAEEIGKPAGITPELEEFVRDYLQAYRSRHIGKSITQIRAALERAAKEQTDPLIVLQQEFDSWKDRPEETSKEEAVRAGNAVALMTYQLGGVEKVRWVATGQSCPYCQHLNGKIVGINTAFIKLGEELKPDGVDVPLTPSRNIKHPPAHAGCDCLILAGL